MLREKVNHMAIAVLTTAPSKVVTLAKRDFPVEVCHLSRQYNNVRALRRPLGMIDPKTREEIVFDDLLTKCHLAIH